MIVSFAKMRFHCRVLIEEYFPLPSSDDIATSPQNVKMYSVMCEIAFQSERCNKAVHTRVLKTSRVNYSKTAKSQVFLIFPYVPHFVSYFFSHIRNRYETSRRSIYVTYGLKSVLPYYMGLRRPKARFWGIGP
jgi:hypothetical protein